jgi:heat shock protein HslJ
MTLGKLSITLLIVTGVLLVACQPVATPATQAPQPTQAPQATQVAQPAPSGAGQQLTGTVWKWTMTQMNDGSSKTPDDPNKYLIEFLADGHVAIQADCNRVAGTYVANGNQLAITLGPSTLAACPPGSLGDEFVKQLGNIGSYLFKNENLILEIKFDSGSMTFAPSVPGGLPGTSWKVINYNNGKQAVVSLAIGTEISLNFGTDGRLSGNSGCNTYNGGFEASGNTLKVGPLVSTMMACAAPEGVMEQEQQYLAALQNSATFEIAGDTLTIRDASGAMQVVAKVNTPAGLPGTSWKVMNYNNGREAVVGLITDSKIDLNFGADGQVSGSSGCNRYSGGYEASGTALKVGPLVSTMMACDTPAGVMEQEQQYLAALQNAATYEIMGDTLTIRDAGGATQVVAKVNTPAGLPGTAWKVTMYNNGREAVVGMIADSEITLNFGAEGQVSGNSGCNNYSGGYETSGDQLKIGPLASTRMFCDKPAGVMDQEQQYLAALQNAATYEIMGDTLTIRDAGGATQVVAKVNTPAGLSGTAWEVTMYNNGKEAVVGLIADSKVTLNFSAEGQVNGNSGCNTYSGGYETSGDALKIGPLASTMMACAAPEGVMDQEQLYLAALQNAATYDISGSTLTIRDAGGATQVVAQANAPAGLPGTSWEVTMYNNGREAVVGLITDSKIDLNFGADRQVSGNSGCNTYSGGYEASGAALKVGPLASTMMACDKPAGVMDQEQQYLAALQNAATYEIAGDTLTIRDANGAMQVVATATP